MYCYIDGTDIRGDDCHQVGFYKPGGGWIQESDYEHADDAARRVNYLNGGVGDHMPEDAATG